MEKLNLVFILMAGEIYTCRIEKNECINHKLKGVQGYPIQSKGDIDEWIEDLCESLSIDPEEFEDEELECTVINMDWDMPMVLRLLKTLDTKTSKVIDGISTIPGIVLNKCEIKAGAEYSVNILGVAWKIKVSEAMELSCELEGSSSNGVAIGVEEFIFPYTWKGKIAYSNEEKREISEIKKQLQEQIELNQKQEQKLLDKEKQFGQVKQELEESIRALEESIKETQILLEDKNNEFEELKKSKFRIFVRMPFDVTFTWSYKKKYIIGVASNDYDPHDSKMITGYWNSSEGKVFRTDMEFVEEGECILIWGEENNFSRCIQIMDKTYDLKRARVIAPMNGKLIYLVKEGQKLKKNDVFAVIVEEEADTEKAKEWALQELKRSN